MAAVTDLFRTCISVFKFLLELLPNDPFVNYIDSAVEAYSEYAGYLNYFVPVGRLADITGVWISAISVYYAYRIAKKAVS